MTSNVLHLRQALEFTKIWLQDFMAQPEHDDPQQLAGAGLECTTCGMTFKLSAVTWYTHILMHLNPADRYSFDSGPVSLHHMQQ